MINKALYLFCLFILFSGCKTERYEKTEVNSERIPIDSSINEDAEIASFIKPYSQNIIKILDSVLAYNPQDLNKSNGELNTAIGNLMADAVWEQANPIFKSRTGKDIDLVILNHGGIRAPINKGAITTRTAYNVMPFENEIVVAEIEGTRVMEMLTYLESNRTPHPLSGITIKVDENYKVWEAKIDGREIDTNQTYFVATSDYLLEGGDNMNFFKDAVNVHVINYKIRNALIDYFHKVDTLKAARDNRYIQTN